MLREYPLAQAFTLELFRGKASQEEREYRPGMVTWRAAVGRKEAGAGCSGMGSAKRQLVHANCFHLPSLQGGADPMPSPPPEMLLCSIYRTPGPGPRSLLRPQPTCKLGLKLQKPTESSSTPQLNQPGSEMTAGVQQQLHASPKPWQTSRDF